MCGFLAVSLYGRGELFLWPALTISHRDACAKISKIEVPPDFESSPEDLERHEMVRAALTMAFNGVRAINGRLVDVDAFRAAAAATRNRFRS